MQRQTGPIRLSVTGHNPAFPRVLLLAGSSLLGLVCCFLSVTQLRPTPSFLATQFRSNSQAVVIDLAL